MFGKRETPRAAFSGHRTMAAGWPTILTDGAKFRLDMEAKRLLCDDGPTQPSRPTAGKTTATSGSRIGPLPARMPNRMSGDIMEEGQPCRRSMDYLITTQAKRNLSSRSGIGGVLSAT